MNFHYYFSSSFATTVKLKCCYSSDFDFPDLARSGFEFDCLISCYFTLGSEEGTCSFCLAGFHRYWLLKSANSGSVRWS